MCDLCDHPDLAFEAHVELVRDRLTRERFLIQGVLGSTTEAEFSYSVGLTAHGLPELVVVGLRETDASRLIQVWGGRPARTRAWCCRARRSSRVRSSWR